MLAQYEALVLAGLALAVGAWVWFRFVLPRLRGAGATE
jgi:hypothetical protein